MHLWWIIERCSSMLSMGRDTYPKGSRGLKNAIAHQKEIIVSYPMKTVPAPGIHAIKQVGMQENYRHLVENKYQNDELYKNHLKRFTICITVIKL